MKSKVHHLVLYFDGSKEYFGKEHRPYAIFAVVFMLIFNIFPAIFFFVYQFSWFQKILNHLPLRLYILHTFMDLLQGHYKNGTEDGTNDCRWFSAVYLILRITMFLVFTFTLSGMFFFFGSVVILLIIILLVYIQPYKKIFAHHATINATFMFFIAFLYASIIGINIAAIMQIHFVLFFCYSLAILFTLLPLIYMFVYTIYWIWIISKQNLAVTIT